VGQAFRQGLRDAGYSEGQDLLIEWRFTDGEYGPVPELVTDLIRHKVEVLVVDATVATRTAKRATSIIPIVMTSIADPVGSGLVATLGHPGGNVTGLSLMATDLTSKRLQVRKDTVPSLTQVAILWNPDMPPHIEAIEQLRSLAPSLGVDLSLVQARRTADLGLGVSDARRAHAQALYVLEDAVFVIHRKTLNGLVEQARLPAIFAQARVVEEGGC
jgi:putative tryptophan/tyrosine transport system substrate-binding protein